MKFYSKMNFEFHAPQFIDNWDSASHLDDKADRFFGKLLFHYYFKYLSFYN